MEHICVPANETLFLTYCDPWAITDITNVVFIHDVMEFFHHELHNHPILLFCSSTSQQCFSLTPLQQQPPASQPAVFFSHTTPAAASSTSTANRVNLGFLWRSHYKYVQFSCHWKVENTSKNPSKNISNFNGNFGTKLITTIIVKIKRDAEIV